ncbi:esterase E4-like [Cimex lectularius]|uniref:Carboxylesterase type B domain-containing protein n=1 Tax=Cimex lectularius TaxID=79782 RepID=A0A8I6TJS4_CIMLE|nr:esterase E4-like [Cimex lectularius]
MLLTAENNTIAVFLAAWHHLQNMAGLKSGDLTESYRGRMFTSFAGVRYAQPPIGDLRFRDPEPIKYYSATGRKIDCLEVDQSDGKVLGQEDCLFLNIHTPDPFTKTGLPVLVWIQGQAFAQGNNKVSDLYPYKLMDYNMVVVTMSYRLGPLGFASMEKADFTGNYGLRDQAMAIEWIIKNIHLYGGNPYNITLAGEGAGASYVLHHLHGEFSGRIKKGIAFGGSRYAPWAISKKKTVGNRTLELALALGCVDFNPDCLRSVDAVRLVKTAYKLQKQGSLFAPLGMNVLFTSSSLWNQIMSHYKTVVDGVTVKSYPWRRVEPKTSFSLLIGLTEDLGTVIRSFFSRNNWSEETAEKVYNSFYDPDRIMGMRRAFYYRSIRAKLINVYKGGGAMEKLENITADSWYFMPAMAEAKFHTGPFEAFMVKFNRYLPELNCEFRVRAPFLTSFEDCPPFDNVYQRVEDESVQLVADFIHGRKLQLKQHSEDKNIFSITQALHTPVAFEEVDDGIVNRMRIWNSLFL